MWNRGSCEPLNAGSFHIGLTNTLGLKGESLIFDIEPGLEVWNFVATAFSSRFLSSEAPQRNSSTRATRRVLVETTVTYAADITPKFNPVLFTEDAYYINRLYEYYLELDDEDQIVGGEWVSKNGPDFMWLQDKAEFRGKWEILNEIYQPISMPL